MTSKQALAAMVEDLNRSGLALEDCKKAGFLLVDAAEVSRVFPDAGVLWAYKIPYPSTHRQGCSPMYRLKVLEYAPLPFGAVRKDPPKYLQPPSTPPGAYFAPAQLWKSYIENPVAPLIFVEGEKKALAGCKAGFNVIGLGGVWSWRSKSLGWGLLPELACIKYADRPLYVCFDSDARTNVEVAKAIVAFSETMTALGARVKVATIPGIKKGEKAGLDDFLVANGKEAFDKYLATCADEGDLAVKLWQMNTSFAAIEAPCVVVNEAAKDAKEQPILRMHRPVDFRTVVAANINANEVVTNAKGEQTIKKVSVAEKWMTWSARRGYETVTYEPGAPRLLNCGSILNTWPGLGVAPKKGSIKPWRELLDHMFKSSPREHRLWFERWCGWPFKHPGAKMFSAVGIWGKPGRGKSIVAEKTLASLYGRNFSSIAQTELEGDFNGWAVNKQFVLVDEVSMEDARSRGNRLKKLITQDVMRINVKYLPHYDLPDRVNYLMTSNSPRAFLVEDDDRRFFIHHVPDEQLPESFFRHYADEWLAYQNAPNFGPGPSALLHYFMNELDYGDFNPKAPPPMTTDKLDMIEAGRHPADDWLRGYGGSELWRANHDRDVYRVTELCTMYQNVGPRGSDRLSPNGFGCYLAAAGMIKRRIDDEGETVRAVAVHNLAKWKKASAAEWKKELHRVTPKY